MQSNLFSYGEIIGLVNSESCGQKRNLDPKPKENVDKQWVSASDGKDHEKKTVAIFPKIEFLFIGNCDPISAAQPVYIHMGLGESSQALKIFLALTTF